MTWLTEPGPLNWARLLYLQAPQAVLYLAPSSGRTTPLGPSGHSIPDLEPLGNNRKAPK